MENDAIPICENPKSVTRSHWKRSLVELNGKSGRNYLHDVSPLLMKSYAEIGAFPHEHRPRQPPCTTYTRHVISADTLRMLYSGSASDYNDYRLSRTPVAFYLLQTALFKVGVSALEFDTKGTRLASVTGSGCLTVHDVESLYNHSDESNEEKLLLHYSSVEGALRDGINVVRWNPSNDDEIAFASEGNTSVSIFDMCNSYSEPTEVFRRKHVRFYERLDISDIAFVNGNTRVLASDKYGVISMWIEERAIFLKPSSQQIVIRAISRLILALLASNYLKINQSGFIYVWDLRGERSSDAFQSGNEGYSFPLPSVNLVSMLNDTAGPLKAQSHIRRMEIHSININPTCPYQLGFHLEDGCSGVLDMHNFQMSHIHSPAPSPWMDGPIRGIFVSPQRKPSWLPKHSIYVVPSTSSKGLHLLDFYPHCSSPCHVEYDDSKSTTVERKQSVFVPLSKRVTACAVHPLSDTIVAGTMEASLLVISQKHLLKKGDDDDGDDDDDDDDDDADEHS